MSHKLGIDVGGTNTDAVILDGSGELIAKTKTPTTEDVTGGIVRAMSQVLAGPDVDPNHIGYAMLGTTHCTNAIVERQRLARVAVIRIGAPATLGVKPLTGWPEDLKSAVGGFSRIVGGGHEFDGRRIGPLDEDGLRRALHDMDHIEAVAVTSVFSPVNTEDEVRAAEIVGEELGDIPVSLSHEIASIGLLERENATVLNAAVVKVARGVAAAFERALLDHGINVRPYFGQNDGTLMTVDYAVQYPILTIACGPTNSIRGAAYLSGLRDALVVDVGGTTTDVGVLQHRFPRESSIAVEIGGVRTNFRMPDLMSIGLGGGSRVRVSDEVTVGPDSVGHRLTQEAQVFGGSTLTATDVAVKAGLCLIGDRDLVEVEEHAIRECQAKIVAMVENAVDRMKTSAQPVPVVLVGGGSVLLPDQLVGASEVLRPEHHEVANAIGAAIAQVSGQIERVFSLDELGREQALEQAKEMAKAEAVRAGADRESLEIVEVDDVPLAYLPGNATRIRVKAAGDLAKQVGD